MKNRLIDRENAEIQASSSRSIRIDPDAYYPEGELAALFGVTRDKLRRDRQIKSDLAFCKFGRRVFYRGADVLTYLDSNRRMSTSDAGVRANRG